MSSWLFSSFSLAGNICINTDTHDNKVQIIDFGSAQKTGNVKNIMDRTYDYFAPEVCRLILMPEDKSMDFPLTGKSDVFSCALCLKFLLDKNHLLRNYYSYLMKKFENIDSFLQEILKVCYIFFIFNIFHL